MDSKARSHQGTMELTSLLLQSVAPHRSPEGQLGTSNTLLSGSAG